MSFDKWLRRPVYVVQCYTCMIARSTSIFDFLNFRTVPGPWRKESQLLRDATAAKLRELRRTCGLDRRHVRLWFEKTIISGESRGYAQRVDLQAMLGLHGSALIVSEQ